MEENHQDKPESKQTTTGDKSQLPLLSLKDEEVAQKDEKKAQKELARLRKDRKKLKQLPIIVGISTAFVGALVLSYIWFRFNWPWEVLILISIGIVLLIVLIRAGYTVQWTGFSGKTGWDWLNVLGVFLIPLMIAVFTITSNIQQTNITLDQQRETALQTYLGQMSDLLLVDNLRMSKPGDEVRQIARARTLTVLRSLDGKRKGYLLLFLYEAKLINNKKDVIVDLREADLSYADLREADLSGADLSVANLEFADLSGADLTGAILQETNFKFANLTHTILRKADLSHANFYKAEVTKEQLAKALILTRATMPDGSTHP